MGCGPVLKVHRDTLIQTAFHRASATVNILVPCKTAQTRLIAFCRVSICPASHSRRPRSTHLPAPKALNNDGEVDSPVIAPPNGSSTRKGTCYGCGIALQTEDVQSPGFVDPEKYELKKHHRQLDQLVCLRCQSLSNGAMVPGVEDMWVPPDGSPPRRLLSPAQLRQQLADIKGQRALVVLLIDLTDASGSFLGRVRDLVGQNPIILVGTKVDLLPKGTSDEAVVQWLQATANHKRLNVARVSLCSSRSKAGVPETVAAIRKERKGRNVYIIGAANVGKSAFTRALVREMSQLGSMQYDAAAAGAKRRLPVESAMPGTTLHMIPLKAFESGGTLYDTPGLHLHHRIQHMMSPQEVRALQPRARLKPYIPPRTPSHAATSPGDPEGVTYLIGGLAQIDVLSAPPSAHLTFFMPPALRVETLPLLAADATPSHRNTPTSSGSATPLGGSPPEAGQATNANGAGPGDEISAHGVGGSGEEGMGEGRRGSLEEATVQSTPGRGEGATGHSQRGSSQEASGQGRRGSLREATGQGSPGRPEEATVHAGRGSLEESHAAGGLGSDMQQTAGEGGEGGECETERFGERSVAARGGLYMAREVWLKAAGGPDVADIAISGLPGWVAVVIPSGKGSVWLRIWVPVGVEVFVRPSMPAGPPADMGGFPAPAPVSRGARTPAGTAPGFKRKVEDPLDWWDS